MAEGCKGHSLVHTSPPTSSTTRKTLFRLAPGPYTTNKVFHTATPKTIFQYIQINKRNSTRRKQLQKTTMTTTTGVPYRHHDKSDATQTTTTTTMTTTSNNQVSSSTKLFGQDHQREQLKNAFLRCCDPTTQNRQSELAIIAGTSGTGKTALARTLQHRSKYFVLGKCDQFQQGSEPFGPFIVALNQLADIILREDQQTIQSFQNKAQQAITESTEVTLLTDMAPILANFFPNNKPSDNTHHNNTARTAVMQHPDVENPVLQIVCKFLQTICSHENTLVIVIDDLQWIDLSSLDLLEKLAHEQSITGFMLVATCRDDEMTADKRATQVLQNLQQPQNDNNVTVSYIHVTNLSLEAVTELASDRFPTLPALGLEALATTLHQHTKGNAFFVIQVLQRLEDAGWKAPKYLEETKDWDFDDHRSMVDRFIKYDCDALVDVVVIETANRSSLIRRVLKAASCLGSDFVSSHVMMMIEDSDHGEDEIFDALSLIENCGIIVRRPGRNGAWSWTHDKYQKAAYLLIESSERGSFHLSVGRQLLSGLDDDDLQQYIFIVVSQFGISLKLIEEDEKENIANLFLRAGKKSASSSSFGAAASYFAMGTSLLKVDNWTSQYDLSLRLYNAAAEMECFRGHFQKTDKLVNVLLRNARTLQDQMRAYEIKIYSHGAKQELKQASYLALDVYTQLGVKLPKEARTSQILYEIISTKMFVSGKTESDIMSLPPLRDWKKIAILRVMHLSFPPMMKWNAELCVIITCRCMKTTLRDGICGMTVGSFLTAGISIVHPFNFIEEAIKLSTISEKILEEYGVDEMKSRHHVTHYSYTLPYKRPLREMLEHLEKGGNYGLMAGDLDMACLCFDFFCMFTFFSGHEIQQVLSTIKEYIKKYKGWGQHLHVSYLSITGQTIENLIGDTEGNTIAKSSNIKEQESCTLTGTVMDEEKWMEDRKAYQDDLAMNLFWFFKVVLATYLGEYETASHFVVTLMEQNLLAGNAGMFHQTYFIVSFLEVVTLREEKSDLQLRKGKEDEQQQEEAQPRRRKGLFGRKKKTSTIPRKQFNGALKKLCGYGKFAPECIMNKLHLIEAEYAVLKKAKVDAKSKFRLSIEQANQQGLIQEEALSYERYAIALFEWGEITESLEYFERARYLYEQWGSAEKVKRLTNFVRDVCGVKNTSWNKEE